MAKQIDTGTLKILSETRIEGNTIYLTCPQLNRKEYMAVNDVLTKMGGKWNTRAKGHIFTTDPTDSLEQVLLTGEISPPENYGCFFTPQPLAAKVIVKADIKPGMLVLEPQAGQAALADEAAKIVNVSQIKCIEYLENNIAVLRQKGYEAIHADFLTITPEPIYDRIIMNPPFARQADINHVLHAFEFLKPGGKLTSIMSNGITFREDNKSKAFRSLLEQRGSYITNPEGSFRQSGTMVNTIIAELHRPF